MFSNDFKRTPETQMRLDAVSEQALHGRTVKDALRRKATGDWVARGAVQTARGRARVRPSRAYRWARVRRGHRPSRASPGDRSRRPGRPGPSVARKRGTSRAHGRSGPSIARK
jgi:hypothetical protein